MQFHPISTVVSRLKQFSSNVTVDAYYGFSESICYLYNIIIVVHIDHPSTRCS